MPDPTDLVKDLPADFAIFGNAVDSTVKTNADAAIAKTIVDAKGDIIAATAADTVSRLAVGANDTVLTADSSTATGLKWAAPSSGGMTLISTTTLSGATTTLSSIPSTYNNLAIIIKNFKPANDGASLRMRFNSDSAANRHYTNTTFGSVASASFDSTDIQLSGAADDTTATGLMSLTIPDYTNTTTYKTCFSYSFVNDLSTPSTNLRIFTATHVYNQTGAISSLDFIASGGNITSGTVLLYGVK
jgi:hypothetical protein